MSCKECGNKYIMYHTCGPVEIETVVDIFHIGRCPNCGYTVDEPCPKRIEGRKLEEKTLKGTAQLFHSCLILLFYLFFDSIGVIKCLDWLKKKLEK